MINMGMDDQNRNQHILITIVTEGKGKRKGFRFVGCTLMDIQWVFIGSKSRFNLWDMVVWLEVVCGLISVWSWFLICRVNMRWCDEATMDCRKRNRPLWRPPHWSCTYPCRHHKAGRDVLYAELDLNDHNVIPNQVDRPSSCWLIDVHHLFSCAFQPQYLHIQLWLRS